MNELNDVQEAAEPRKMYGTSSTPDFGALLPSAGDPVFETDSQNNDEFYCYDTDVPRDVDETSEPAYGD